MLQIYYCPECKKMRILSNHSAKKGREICPSCGSEHVLADISYAEWGEMGDKEREECIKAYADAYPNKQLKIL